MARKRYKPEEIVGLLRQAEVLHGERCRGQQLRNPPSPGTANSTKRVGGRIVERVLPV